MATLIRHTGEEQDIEPHNLKSFQLDQLYQLLDTDMVQVISTTDGKLMIMDEEGKFKDKPRNERATSLANGLMPGDFIVGDVLICDQKQFK